MYFVFTIALWYSKRSMDLFLSFLFILTRSVSKCRGFWIWRLLEKTVFFFSKQLPSLSSTSIQVFVGWCGCHYWKIWVIHMVERRRSEDWLNWLEKLIFPTWLRKTKNITVCQIKTNKQTKKNKEKTPNWVTFCFWKAFHISRNDWGICSRYADRFFRLIIHDGSWFLPHTSILTSLLVSLHFSND